MSWSICFIGNPDNIVNALEKESEHLTGFSKEEFDVVKPMLSCLVRQNFNNNGAAPVLRLTANGHSYAENGQPKYGSTNVNIENVSGTLV